MTRTMVDTEVISRALELACRSPSLHNSQPWRWVVGRMSVDLFTDPHRIVTEADSSGREAIISCGAVLDHFRVAMAAAGWDCQVDYLPNPNNRDHLAAIDFVHLDSVAEARRDRAKAISQRRTDRRPFRAPKDWPSVEPLLFSCYDSELATLEVLPDEVRPQLAEASRLAESLRRYDDEYQHELTWWTEPSRESDGIPHSSLLSESQARRVDVQRRFPAKWYQERGASGVQDEGKILLLTTPADTRLDALNCGQALSSVLLECTMAGLATCPVSHLTEVETSRDMVRQLSGATEAMPQVLIRVGIELSGKSPQPTPRRPLSDVVEIHR